MAEDLREDLAYLLWLSLQEMSEEDLLRMCCLLGSLSDAPAPDDENEARGEDRCL